MIIISDNNTYETKWVFDKEKNSISYFFEGGEARPNHLGRLEGDQIISESTRPFGKILVLYEKE
jgi:hypothetical protein